MFATQSKMGRTLAFILDHPRRVRHPSHVSETSQFEAVSSVLSLSLPIEPNLVANRYSACTEHYGLDLFSGARRK